MNYSLFPIKIKQKEFNFLLVEILVIMVHFGLYPLNYLFIFLA